MKSLLFAAMVVTVACAQDASVPVELEPNHPTVLKNDYIQVFRVTLAPGKSSLMHTHARNDAAMRLSESRVTVDVPGRPTSAPELQHPGGVSARTNEGQPFTHRVNNVGTTLFDVLDIQILKRPDGPEVEAISAPAAENPSMRVYRYELAPGQSSPQHTHQRPYLIVAGTDLDLKMTSADGKSAAHPVKSGDMHWIETKVTHTLTNEGKTTGVIAEIELK